MSEPTQEDFRVAEARGERRRRGPRAESAFYDAGRDRVIVRLTTGIEIGFAPGDAQGLAGASPEELSNIELSPLGLGIHFPRLDADLYVPALLNGVLGSRRWEAERLAGRDPAGTRRDGARRGKKVAAAS